MHRPTPAAAHPHARPARGRAVLLGAAAVAGAEIIEFSHVRDQPGLPLAHSGVERLLEVRGNEHADARHVAFEDPGRLSYERPSGFSSRIRGRHTYPVAGSPPVMQASSPSGDLVQWPAHVSRPNLAKVVASGRFVLTTSLGTLPRADEAMLRRRLGQIRGAFGFVKFGDNPRARARVSPWAAAAVAIGEGVEPIVHVGCRDRNRLAIQADLLGGRLLGVRNVLCLRGDDIGISDQIDALAVHDLDVVDLVRLASRDEAFFVLAACDPAVPISESHTERLRAKLHAGAALLETQPVFDTSRFAAWLRSARDAGVDAPMLVDVSVVATPGQAELLDRIPHVQPPSGLADRLRRDTHAGIALAAEVIAELRDIPGVAGCHLSPVGGDPATALAVVDRAR